MSNTRIPIPSFYGGVSQQPASIRKADQLAGTTNACDNATLSVRNGMSKRPASLLIAKPTGFTTAGTYRIHAYDRDGSEQYLIVYSYGSGNLRVFDVSGNEYYVRSSTAAETYRNYGNATANDIRMTTVADYTIICNTLVNTDSVDSDPFTVTEEYFDADDMFSNYGTIDAYYRTKVDVPGYTAGYWKFTPGTLNTPATIRGRINHGMINVAQYELAARNPGGFRLGLGRMVLSSSNFAWVTATGAITLAGAFANYTWQSGDQIYVLTSTGMSPTLGWHTVLSKSSDDTILIAAGAIHASDQTITVQGIGKDYLVTVNFSDTTEATMFDVAQRFQDAIRAATGKPRFLCSWKAIHDGGTADGYFTITAPNDGSTSFLTNPTTPGSSYFNYAVNASGGVFYPGGSNYLNTVGTGNTTDEAIDPIDRWTRVPPPQQKETQPDQTTMPIKLTREFYKTNGCAYTTEVEADEPFAYWRLGDTGSPAIYAKDEVGQPDPIDGLSVVVATNGNNPGLYAGDFTTTQTGAIANTTNKAVLFGGTNANVNLGTLGNLGSLVKNGLTVEAWVKTSNSSTINPIFAGGDQGGSATFLAIVQNCTDAAAATFAANNTSVCLYRDATNYIKYRFPSTGTTNGAYHHFVVTFDPATLTIALYIDGTAATATSNSSSGTLSTTDSWANFLSTYPVRIGAQVDSVNTAYFTGTIDDVSVYNEVLSDLRVRKHYDAGILATAVNTVRYFDLDLIDWKFRETGDPDTNPIPSIIKNNKPITSVAFHRNRLVLGGNTNIVMSQASDFFNLYAEDFNNLGDSDPIDISLSGNAVAFVSHIVPFRKGMMIFTQAGQQFELNAPETLTPSTATVTPTTAYQTLQNVRPVTMGNQLYFPAERGGDTQVYEYFYDDSQAASTAAEITSHCDSYVPSNIKTMLAVTNNYCVVVLPTSSNSLYLYRYFWAGNQKIQSAWSRWTYTTGVDDDTICDIAVIRNDVYMLTEAATGSSDNKFSIVKQPIPDPDPPTGLAFDPLLDSRQTVTGTYSAPNTTWTIQRDVGYAGLQVIAGNGFSNEGEALTVASSTVTSVTVAGNYSAYPCYIGRPYTMTAELSRPYQRDRNNGSIIDSNVQLDKLTVNFTDSGSFAVQIEQPGRTTRTHTYAPPTGSALASGDYPVLVWGNAKDTTVKILSSSHKPCTLTMGEWTATFTPRSQ